MVSGATSAGTALLRLALDLQSPTHGGGANTYRVGGAHGVWGGSCTCPNGQVYQVADQGSACASLACVGGTPDLAHCNHGGGSWSGNKVVCAQYPNASFIDRSVLVLTADALSDQGIKITIKINNTECV